MSCEPQDNLTMYLLAFGGSLVKSLSINTNIGQNTWSGKSLARNVQTPVQVGKKVLPHSQNKQWQVS